VSAVGTQYDIVIVGAGPSGLCFAASLRELPLRVALIERLGAAALADPPYDGREIALTQRSARLLRDLGIWERLPVVDVSPLRGARVLNGEAPAGLDIRPGAKASAELGYLVSNHLIRRAAHANVRDQARLTLLADTGVESVTTDEGAAHVTLSDGNVLGAKLVVAADTRFSETRRAMGIAARHHDFGKSMLVCRLQHALPHEHIALEWFAHLQTLALLPLNGDRSSAVLTLPHGDIERLRQLPVEHFNSEITQRFMNRFGPMSLASERFAYPLVAVYPERFYATRYATIGDAAVGMHPVTAHGFNFGLRGQATLARLIAAACRQGEDIGAERLLRQYDSEHRRATRPLYLATNAIVSLYTAESLPARMLRGALLRIASHTPPVAAMISAILMQDAALTRGAP
jgi:ubiquinone biosynthesis UbiH/UbiF/VisC/COQ6 family hydroxylase